MLMFFVAGLVMGWMREIAGQSVSVHSRFVMDMVSALCETRLLRFDVERRGGPLQIEALERIDD